MFNVTGYEQLGNMHSLRSLAYLFNSDLD